LFVNSAIFQLFCFYILALSVWRTTCHLFMSWFVAETNNYSSAHSLQFLFLSISTGISITNWMIILPLSRSNVNINVDVAVWQFNLIMIIDYHPTDLDRIDIGRVAVAVERL
jgi:hypothetical protein